MREMPSSQFAFLRQLKANIVGIVALLALLTGGIGFITNALLRAQDENATLWLNIYSTQHELRDLGHQINSLSDHVKRFENGFIYVESALGRIDGSRHTLQSRMPEIQQALYEVCLQEDTCFALVPIIADNHRALMERVELLVSIDRDLLGNFDSIWRPVDDILLDDTIANFSDLLAYLHANQLTKNSDRFVHEHGAILAMIALFSFALWWLVQPTLSTIRNGFAEIDDQRAILERHSTIDGQTDLYNRRSFMHFAKKALEQPHPCALAIMDIDLFKFVNDSYGHPFGDAVIAAVAKRILSTCRPGINAFRLGGDEFALLCSDENAAADILAVSEELLAKVREPIKYGNKSVRITVSIGVVVGRANQYTVDQLVARADVALYRCKNFSGNQMHLASHQDTSTHNEELAFSLQDAIENGQITPLYQPIVDLRNNSLLGFEALARWQHPVHDSLLPSRWIDQAAQGGMMLSLTRVIVDAIFDHWGDLGDKVPQINLNIHPHLLYDQTLFEFFEEAKSLAGRQWLTMEITEDGKLDANPQQLIETLDRLHRLGVRIALDDFGTGYGSLSHLVRLPIDDVKIDGEFVTTVTESAASLAVVEAQIRCARDLGKTVIAERIETEPQKKLLMDLGCNYGQGFLFGKAFTIEEARTLYDRERKKPRLIRP